MTGTAKAIKHLENDRVIVTEYRFGMGDNTGWHRHAHDYVVVPLLDGRLRLVTASGENFGGDEEGGTVFPQGGGGA
jgi:quercetin dioxygenase-like cupin family protein